MPRQRENENERYGVRSETDDLIATTFQDATKQNIVDTVMEFAEKCSDERIKYQEVFFNGEHGLAHWFTEEHVRSWKRLPHTTYALGQLLTYLRIPRPYFRRCPDALKSNNFNYWIGTFQDKQMLMRKWNGVVRAFFTTHYTPEMDDKVRASFMHKAISPGAVSVSSSGLPPALGRIQI